MQTLQTAHRQPQFLLTLAGLLLVSGLLLFIHDWRTNQRAQQTAAQSVARANAGLPSAAPSTRKPSTQTVNNYQVVATHPRYLSIPKLHVSARVLAVGTTKSNAIGTPDNVYDTAWYSGSSLPGQAGATLIDGHVSSWTTHGVFYNLQSLRPGDKLDLTLGNDSRLHYSVTRLQTYDAKDLTGSELLASVNADKSGLNLVTCAGDVVKGSNEFSKRVVVYATQL